jgi:hypothetical protein
MPLFTWESEEAEPASVVFQRSWALQCNGYDAMQPEPPFLPMFSFAKVSSPHADAMHFLKRAHAWHNHQTRKSQASINPLPQSGATGRSWTLLTCWR